MKMKTFLLSCLLLVTAVFSHAQGGKKISPAILETVRNYGGKDAKPIVPIALWSEKSAMAEEVATWLAAHNGISIQTITLADAGGAVNQGSAAAEAIPALFAKAAGQLLFITDAELWFGKEQTAAVEERKALLAEGFKTYPAAIVAACKTEACWFALAKAGFGIVKLDESSFHSF